MKILRCHKLLFFLLINNVKMNFLLPFALELFHYALAYIPNICSEKGGVCMDGDINSLITNVLENVFSYLTYPINTVSNTLTYYLDTVFSDAVQETTKESSVVDSAFNLVSNFFTPQDINVEKDQNYLALTHILIFYILYVCIAKRTIKPKTQETVKVKSVLECGDYDGHASDCSSFIYLKKSCGDCENCCCKMDCVCEENDENTD